MKLAYSPLAMEYLAETAVGEVESGAHLFVATNGSDLAAKKVSCKRTASANSCGVTGKVSLIGESLRLSIEYFMILVF
jgi:hypothetical protein